ncbi:acylphosphatase [Bacillus phage vB_BcM_Sam112]|uniref:Acylphosphatase n=1 Tax=Bacillus phage vB_BcM_Sam112 TaxID=2663324 RepID=A0A5Q2F4J3_9CAUD|nr:acylphosphatase [Bacillus phage vB_BcM_Sam112]
MLTYGTLCRKANELKVNVAFDNTEIGTIKFEITGFEKGVKKMVEWLERNRSYVIIHEYKEIYTEGK